MDEEGKEMAAPRQNGGRGVAKKNRYIGVTLGLCPSMIPTLPLL